MLDGDRGPLPAIAERASVMADMFEPLFWYIIAWTSAGFLLVCALLAWCCVAYRRKPGNIVTRRSAGPGTGSATACRSPSTPP